MKKLIFSISLVFVLAGQGWATIYFIAQNGTAANKAAATGPINDLSKCMSASVHNGETFSAGDIIDGGNSTFYGSRIIPPSSGSIGSPITYQNFTLSGRVSWNGTWGLAWPNGGTYEQNSWNAWALYSGEIYKKNTYLNIHRLWEDGTELESVVSASMDDVNALKRGQFTNYNYITYYRASDGQNVSTHNIEAPKNGTLANGGWDAGLGVNFGMLMLTSVNYITLSNITLQDFSPNAYSLGALFLDNTNNITINNVMCNVNAVGAAFNVTSNIAINGLQITNNINTGMLIQGNTYNFNLINSTITNNGRTLYYPGNSSPKNYDGDNDGIGIGGYGGNLSGITITKSVISFNGAPNSATTKMNGTGIYFGTSASMTVDSIKILYNVISGNHIGGIIANHQVHSGVIAYNEITSNTVGLYTENLAFGTYNIYSGITVVPVDANCGTITISNNTISGNGGTAGLFVANYPAGNPGKVIVKNNIFYNNGKATDHFLGDLYMSGGYSYVIESNNVFYRKGTAWDSANVIRVQDVTYDINHIVGSSAGTWQYASSKGANDSVSDPLFSSSTNNFHLNPASPCIASGTFITGVHDQLGCQDLGGLACDSNRIPIGAYAYGGLVAPTLKIVPTNK